MNVTEFDLINSFHLHGMFFDVFRTGTPAATAEKTDTLMLCQGERAILETRFRYPGKFMFHAHQSEFAELGWMGMFEASRRAVTARDHRTGRRAARLGRWRSRRSAAARGARVLRSCARRRPTRCARATRRRSRCSPSSGSCSADGISLTVLNDGPDPVTHRAGEVDDAYWPFTPGAGGRRSATWARTSIAHPLSVGRPARRT